VVDGARVQGRRSWLAWAGTALLVVGCAAPGGSPSPSAAVPEPTVAAESPSAAASAAVSLATDPTLGDILVGEGGKTLYIFTQDAGGTSVCTGDCAAAWPPLVLGDGETPVAGEGVTGALATIARDDGAVQVTYAGAPLYYYAADAKAGDVLGHNVNGVWFVATPSGTSGSGASPTPEEDEYSRGGGSSPAATP
jgi:predicted lipoprotein with Yx(FWY)xxD motif